jgi:hypothetical protein
MANQGGRLASKAAITMGRGSRWRVAWIAKGRVISKDFGTDLMSALELYDKAKAAEKRGATLICINFAHDPPEKYRPHVVRKVKKDIVVRRGKRKVVKEIVTGRVRPMKKLNAEGVWWCPYCIKFRKFQFKTAVKHEGLRLPEPGFYCPMCGISHKDWNVRQRNPIAERIYNEPGKLMKSGRGQSRRRRRR